MKTTIDSPHLNTPSRRPPVRGVAIIGCGVAGPVLGRALAMAGYKPTIYEAHDQPRENSGAFLTLSPNGLNALDEAGLREGVARLGHPCTGLDFHNESGRFLGRVDGSQELRKFGAQTMLIRRAALVRHLRQEAERAGVSIEFGKRLSSFEQLDGGVRVHFADGTAVEAAMAVGCDGVFSRTRREILPGTPAPRYTGFVSAGGFVPHSDLPVEPRTMRMHFGRQAFFGYFVGPDREVYWFSNIAVRSEAEAAELCQPQRRQFLRDWIYGYHHSDVAPVPQILQATGEDLGCWPVYEVPRIPIWSRETVCLIGDAAHAMPPHGGQGASAAIEDAIALTNTLVTFGDPAYAFAAFEVRRRERVDRLIALARRNGSTKRANPVARLLRDLILPGLLRRQSLDWVYGHRESLRPAQVNAHAGV